MVRKTVKSVKESVFGFFKKVGKFIKKNLDKILIAASLIIPAVVGILTKSPLPSNPINPLPSLGH